MRAIITTLVFSLFLLGCPHVPPGPIDPTPTPTPTAEPTPSPTPFANIKDHPRIWVDVAKLQAKAIDSNPIWEKLEAANKRYVNDCNSSYQALNMSAGWLATGKADWLACAKESLLWHINGYTLSSDRTDYGSIVLVRLSAVYDWLYSELTELERKRFREWVENKLLPHLHTHKCNHHAPEYWCRDTHNLIHTKLAGEFVYSIATYEDNKPLYEKNRIIWDRVKDVGSRLFGVPYGGSHYGFVRTHQMFQDIQEALLTAFGESRLPYTEDLPNYWVNSVLPSGDEFLAAYEPGAAKYSSGRHMASSMAYANPSFQHFFNNIFLPGRWVSSYYLATLFIRYDPEMPEIPQESLSYNGQTIGITRSSWTKDATWAAIFSNHWVGDHHTNNCGSIRIWKGSHYVVENGGRYNVGYPAGSSSDPLNANIICLPGERCGFPSRFTEHECTITSYKENGSNAIFNLDLSGSYPAHTGTVTREFVHLRPSTFVVIDRIAGTDTATVRFHLPEHVETLGEGVGFPGIKIIPLMGTITTEEIPDKTGASDLAQTQTDNPQRIVLSGSNKYITVISLGALQIEEMSTGWLVNGYLVEK